MQDAVHGDGSADAPQEGAARGPREVTAAPTLRGRRVTLRPLREDDRARLLSILEEPEVARWWRRTDWERIVQDAATTFAIDVAVDDKYQTVGMIQYDEELDPDYRRASIDLFLATAAQGQGLGTEALQTLVRYLVDVHGHHRITIDPVTENARAIRCYEKAGFRPVGVMQQYERVAPGTYRDALLMEFLAADPWP